MSVRRAVTYKCQNGVVSASERDFFSPETLKRSSNSNTVGLPHDRRSQSYDKSLSPSCRSTNVWCIYSLENNWSVNLLYNSCCSVVLK